MLWEMGIYGKVHSFSSEADFIWFLRRSQAGLKPVAMVVTCSLTHALLSFSPFATTSLLFHGITLQANYSDMDLISASAFGGTQKSTSGKLSTLGCQWRAQSDSTLRRGDTPGYRAEVPSRFKLIWCQTYFSRGG